MGLDMYLYSGSDIVDEVDGGYTYKTVKDRSEVAYWRKANAIHKWFVDNVQGGTDDCGTYEVTADKLDSLRKTVRSVLSGVVRPEDALPTEVGFFFGSTDYEDDWYLTGLRRTDEAINAALVEIEAGKKIYYHSSW